MYIKPLQEYTASKKIDPPVYLEEQLTGPSFKCIVFVAGITAEGSGNTKKGAKHECAKEALLNLGVISAQPNNSNFIVTPSVSPPKTANHVGNLNELAAKKGVTYPEYQFLTISNGEFIFKCTFLNKTCLGKAFNKKDAKQDSALHMLELVKFVPEDDFNRNVVLNMQPDTKMSNAEIGFVLEAFNRLKVQKETTTHDEPVITMPLNQQKSYQDTEVLKQIIAKLGLNYSLTTIQNSPYVVYAKIDGTDLVFMESDKQKGEAVRKVLQQIVSFSNCGVSLRTNDLISLQ